MRRCSLGRQNEGSVHQVYHSRLPINDYVLFSIGYRRLKKKEEAAEEGLLKEMKVHADASGEKPAIKLVVVGGPNPDTTRLLITYTRDEYPANYVPSVFDNYEATVTPLSLSLSLSLSRM